MIEKNYTLLLDKNFSPIRTINARKALTFLLLDKAQALNPDTYELMTFTKWVNHNEITTREDVPDRIITEKFCLIIPEILVLKKSLAHILSRLPKTRFSKRKVFERDDNLCGYCGEVVKGMDKTIDHIVPVSKGGKSTFDNVVTCCIKCNRKKGDKSLKDIGWKLLHDVTSVKNEHHFYVPASKMKESWKPFLKVG